MKVNKLNMLLSGVLAGALLVALAVGFAVTPAPKATQADSIIGTRSIVLIESNGSVATTVNGDAYYTQFYGSADCFSVWISGPLVAGAPPTVTNKLQVSADASNWADLIGFTAQTTASVVLTRTALAGAYLRNVATVGSTAPVTFSVKCVLKNAST